MTLLDDVINTSQCQDSGPFLVLRQCSRSLLCLDGERVEGQVRGSRAWRGCPNGPFFLRPAGRAEG